MRESQQKQRRGSGNHGERGGARLNFVLILAVIGVVGYALYNYAPVAYHAYLFKDFMQETVNKAAYPPGQSASWVEMQLRAAAKEYDLPPDAAINVQNESGRMAARVRYTHPIQMPGFTYEYTFDHTARSSGFLNPQ